MRQYLRKPYTPFPGTMPQFPFNLLPLDLRRKMTAKGKPPYKDFNDETGMIFVHVPKTAGVSIEASFFGNDAPRAGHRPIVEFKTRDPDRFRRYFKFMFVRNPWDRLVSAYFYIKRGGRTERDKRWKGFVDRECGSFGDFVRLFRTRRGSPFRMGKFFLPQYIFGIDERGELCLDFIGRFERLEEDLEEVRKRTGAPASELQRLNQSGRGDYREYYDDQTAAIVSEIYWRDIELFDYSF